MKFKASDADFFSPVWNFSADFATSFPGLWSERGGGKIRDPGNGVADVDEILSSMS